MLYGTAVGRDFGYGTACGLWSIDLDDNTITRLYVGNDTQWDDDHIFMPNGCTVKDSIVYMVESQADNTGSLGTYDIDSGDMAYSTEEWNVTGDGIVSVGDYLFASSWADGGKLFYLDLNDDDAVFVEMVDSLTSPADIGINTDDGVIAIPSLLTGYIWFVEYDMDESGTGRYSIMLVIAATVATVMNI